MVKSLNFHNAVCFLNVILYFREIWESNINKVAGVEIIPMYRELSELN